MGLNSKSKSPLLHCHCNNLNYNCNNYIKSTNYLKSNSCTTLQQF